MIIRDEAHGDLEAVRRINCAAFGSDSEAQLVDLLRDEGVFIRSRVTEIDGRIVGHVLLSRVWIENGEQILTVASLAPMAVQPDHQRRGIGSALVRDGIELCRQEGLPAIIVVGHPSYYPRFGFSSQTVAHLKSPYAGEAFMGLELVSRALTGVQGRVRYPSAFGAFS